MYIIYNIYNIGIYIFINIIYYIIMNPIKSFKIISSSIYFIIYNIFIRFYIKILNNNINI